MLRAIEYTLLGVSLLVVIGLIIGGSRGKQDLSSTSPPALPHEPDSPSHSGKTS